VRIEDREKDGESRRNRQRKLPGSAGALSCLALSVLPSGSMAVESLGRPSVRQRSSAPPAALRSGETTGAHIAFALAN